MTIKRGLKIIDAFLENQKFEFPTQKFRWLNLAYGQSAKIRFVEELDADSANYSKDRGLSGVIAEHTNPKDYRRKAACTLDSEGRCFGCEMAHKDPRSGWRSRIRFYCNVIVDDGIEGSYVAVWSTGINKLSAFNTIREYSLETGSVSNLEWILSRNGKGTETNYTLVPVCPDAEPYEWEGIDAFDLEKVVPELIYAEQEKFYFDNPIKM